MHSTLAVSVDGLPLGLLPQPVWARSPEPRGQKHPRRKRPTRDQESQRWLTAWEASQRALPPDVSVVWVADSEADIFDLFAIPRRPGAELLIRGTHNRRVDATAKYLWDSVRAQPVRGRYRLSVRRREGQPLRTAELTVRTATVMVQPPQNHKPRGLAPVPLNVILVEELNPPPSVDPSVWLLLTTLPLEAWAQVQQCITW